MESLAEARENEVTRRIQTNLDLVCQIDRMRDSAEALESQLLGLTLETQRRDEEIEKLHNQLIEYQHGRDASEKQILNVKNMAQDVVDALHAISTRNCPDEIEDLEASFELVDESADCEDLAEPACTAKVCGEEVFVAEADVCERVACGTDCDADGEDVSKAESEFCERGAFGVEDVCEAEVDCCAKGNQDPEIFSHQYILRMPSFQSVCFAEFIQNSQLDDGFDPYSGCPRQGPSCGFRQCCQL